MGESTSLPTFDCGCHDPDCDFRFPACAWCGGSLSDDDAGPLLVYKLAEAPSHRYLAHEGCQDAAEGGDVELREARQ